MPPSSEPARASSRLAGTDLVLGFGRRTVVDGVSVELEPGRVTALVGPNGSGKSTLLRALARLHAPSGGAVTLDGDRPATALSSRDFAREVTLFAQSRTAPQGLSVREVVAFGRHPHRRAFAGPSARDREAVEQAMATTGVLSMAERAAGELSGGELQRVWLAACLAQDTGVVLLDEPTNHLDLRYQVETLDLIRDLAEVHGAAIGVVLHDLDHAARVADRLLLLSDGRVLAEGDPLAVLTAEHIEAAYGLRVEVAVDERTGHLRIDPVSRHTVSKHSSRLHDPLHPTPARSREDTEE
ncbi:ABC transporter ATP-binding protein [Rathayibacter sp. VKM Ac-2926]|uniref:ABC transporter ATP-binding protein n=1 Tax=Rathayibacter sp. VKM Ac-2926 TaxID=2929477 RepID=UPI001FB4FABC|nr:ABC transporter ATP-binding protein [Rathayibacter sp. VKM Ac-2926]MCJ1702357.1 ABC transporter ATP-binding protein [Rathayibacter sp. VKM Ac-2926]